MEIKLLVLRFLLFLCLIGVSLAVETSWTYFVKVEKSNSVVQYSKTELQARSLSECAGKCQLHKCACFSFSSQICSIGKF
ncbi:C-type lectin domain family 4 member M [Biomphalaria glabrata]|nr:C-type lectin domain family 4 member M [Biomphalaria glabrata]